MVSDQLTSINETFYLIARHSSPLRSTQTTFLLLSPLVDILWVHSIDVDEGIQLAFV